LGEAFALVFAEDAQSGELVGRDFEMKDSSA
jgi:hypothetical protein